METPPPTPPDDATQAATSEAHAPSPSRQETIGPYRILEKLGEGGFGEVYAAEQTEPVKRRVALKILKPGMDTKAVLARFEAERQALAMMDHPHIAKVLDAGQTPMGRPYFVMELIRGEKITSYCDRQRLPTEERLELFIRVCHAIQHAHQKGVIHRDIKPGNILITTVDGKPAPKVIDFGIAKATAAALTEKTLYTMQGHVIGTPAYMSPEQAEMTGLNVDTRTDIYSLGVLLYELLTGTVPFETETLMKAGLDSMRRIIREKEPPKPSTRITSQDDADSRAATRRAPTASRLARAVRGELDWITMKALEKDPGRRYDTATGLAADVRRYLDDEPVVAGPPSGLYRMRKYVRRHRAAVAVAAIVFLTLAGGLFESNRQRTQATAARDDLASVVQSMEDMLASVDPQRMGKDVTVKQMLDETAKTIGEKYEGRPLIEAQIRRTIGNTYTALGEYEAAEPHLTRAVDLQRDLLGPEDPRTLSTMDNLGWLYEREGRYQDAVDMFSQVLETRQRLLGDGDVATADARNSLGFARYRQGQFDRADTLLSKALEVQSAALGEGSPTTLDTMNNLALVLLDQGRYQEAESLDREVLEKRTRVLGEEHPSTLTSMANLALFLRAEGRYQEAESFCRDLAEKRTRVFGEEHPETLTSVAILAIVLREEGRYREAESLDREVLEKRKRVLGEEHPSTLNSMGELASVLNWQGRYEEAEALHREVLEKRTRALGREHPATLDTMNNLVKDYVDHGRLEDAEPLAVEIVNLQARVRGRQHPATLNAINNLAVLYGNLGRYDEARPLLEEALKGFESTLGSNHPQVAVQRYNLACLEANLDHPDKAMAWLRQAVDSGFSLIGIVHDSDLEPLHGPEFDTLVERVRANAEAAKGQ